MSSEHCDAILKNITSLLAKTTYDILKDLCIDAGIIQRDLKNKVEVKWS